MKPVLFTALALLTASTVWAGDAELAKAYAVSAAKLASDGKTEKAKQLCYKALANDEGCPDALLLLGRMFKKEGRTALAGSFFGRCLMVLQKGHDTIERRGHLKQARRLALETNPHSLKLKQTMEQYATELRAIYRKNPDSMLATAARNRVRSFNLSRYVSVEKLPRFGGSSSSSGGTGSRATGGAKKDPVPSGPTGLNPDIERALKRAGWETITGTWKKHGPNRYEVTNGRLSAKKTNGAITLFVYPTGSGTVSAFVRYKSGRKPVRRGGGGGFGMGSTGSLREGPGYGFVVKKYSAALYTPLSRLRTGTSSQRAYLNYEDKLPASYPKHHFLVAVMGSKLQVRINTKRPRKYTYPIEEDGTFEIIVDGTRVIELPKAQ